MPRNATTGVFTRVSNSFSNPVFGTLIDPNDADAYFDDLDVGLNPPELAGPLRIIDALQVGTSGTAAGTMEFFNAASGSITLTPPVGALGTRSLILPVANDTLVGKATTDTFTNKTFNSAGTGNTLQVSGVTLSAGQYPGETTTGNATAGNVGEYVESVVTAGSAVALTTGTAKTVTSISLTAGDWDVDLSCYFVPAATTSVTLFGCYLSLVNNTFDITMGRFGQNTVAAYVPGSGTFVGANVPPYRFSLSGTTTIYFIALANFTVSTMGACGLIRARRAR